ncbi:MAG: aminotransferase class V-fold PLP-dependent enzyme, partial [Xanthobacteraceae bacterium]
GRFASEHVTLAPVTAAGRVDPEALRQLLRGTSATLVSIMFANNETGVLQPVFEASEVVHEAGGLLHVDAVQAFGRLPLRFESCGADFLTLSAHKLGGPKGVGVVAALPDRPLPEPLIRGGGQERSHRAGTENVAGIAGFAAAAAAALAAMAGESQRLMVLRDRLEAGLSEVAGTVIFARESSRLPNTVLAARPNMKAETTVIAFDLAGIAVSSGAACSSGKVQPSHVLAAMGVTEDMARGAIRISFGHTTTEADIDRCVVVWRDSAS